MHPYFLLAGVLVSLSGVLVVFYILAFRYYFLEKERNQLVTLVFHQLYELLRSIHWYTALIREIGKVPADKVPHLDTINSGIDEVLRKHVEYFPREKGKEPSPQSMSLVGKMLRHSKIPDVLHDFLDLLTAIKWETEILAYDPKAKTETVQVKIYRKIDERIDDTISLMDQFLRISSRQQHMNEKSARNIMSGGTGEFLTPEQKNMLKLGA